MTLSGDHVIRYGLLCSMSQVERNRDHRSVPKFWWHRACINAKMQTNDYICKFGPKVNHAVRYDCQCCGQQMQLVELDDRGRFKSNTR